MYQHRGSGRYVRRVDQPAIQAGPRLCLFEQFDAFVSKMVETVVKGSESERSKFDALKELHEVVIALFSLKARSEALRPLMCQSCRSKQFTDEELSRLEGKLFSYDRVIVEMLMLCLIQNETANLTIMSLRVLTLLNYVPSFREIVEAFNLKLYIIRLLDLCRSKKELCVLIQFIRSNFSLYSNEEFIYAMFACMCNSAIDSSLLCLETILEISCKCPLMVSKCQILPELLNQVIYSYTDNELLVEIVVLVLCQTVSLQECRQALSSNVFGSLIVPFIDYHIVYAFGDIRQRTDSSDALGVTDRRRNMDHNSSQRDAEFEFDAAKIMKIYSSCARAIISVMKNFSGLIYFTSFGLENVKNLLKCLNIHKDSSIPEEMKVCILNNFFKIFYELFEIQVEVPAAEKYLLSYSNSIYSIHEEFINAEYKLIVNNEMRNKPRSNVATLNMKVCYKAFLLNIFTEAGIFEHLIQFYYSLAGSMSIEAREQFSAICLNLLAELCYMSNYLLCKEFNFSDLPAHLIHPFAEYLSPTVKFDDDYRNLLNKCEKEKEIVSFIAEFYREKSFSQEKKLLMNKNFYGSIFFQQFLVNCNLSSESLLTFMDEKLVNVHAIQRYSVKSKKSNSNTKQKVKEKLAKIDIEVDLSGVLSASTITDWSWSRILKLLKLLLLFQSDNPDLMKTIQENEKINKTLRRLVLFYSSGPHTALSPDSEDDQQAFSLNNILSGSFNFFDDVKSRVIVVCAFNLISFLTQNQTDSEYKSGSVLFMFLNNIKSYLHQEVENLSSDGEVENESFYSLIALFIGYFSSSPIGDQLLSSSKIYDLVFEFVDKCKNFYLLKYLISSFNYQVSDISRIILIKCLSCKKKNSNNFKIFILNALRNILHANPGNLHQDFFEMITSMMLDEHETIRLFCVKLFEECLIIRPDFKEFLIENNQVPVNILKNFNLTKNGKRTASGHYGWVIAQCVFNRFLLNSRYVKILSISMDLNSLINDWIENNLDEHYADLIDLSSFDANSIYLRTLSVQCGLSCQLDTIKIDVDDPDSPSNTETLYRQKACDVNDNSLQARLQNVNPLHLYSALVYSHPDLHALFQENKQLSAKIREHFALIQEQAVDCSKPSTKSIKAALWAIACLFATQKDSYLIADVYLKDTIPLYVKIAEDHFDLNIRGTAFYCLNLLCQTIKGFETIEKYGWTVSASMDHSVSFRYNDMQVDNELSFYNLNRKRANLNLKMIFKSAAEATGSSKVGEKHDNQSINIGFEGFSCITAIPIYSELILLSRKTAIVDEYRRCLSVNDEESRDESIHRKNEIIKMIYSLIAFSTYSINESIKAKILLVKARNASLFDLTFHCEISKTVLFKHNIKHFIRKFIQELFLNVDTSSLKDSLQKSINDRKPVNT